MQISWWLSCITSFLGFWSSTSKAFSFFLFACQFKFVTMKYYIFYHLLAQRVGFQKLKKVWKIFIFCIWIIQLSFAVFASHRHHLQFYQAQDCFTIRFSLAFSSLLFVILSLVFILVCCIDVSCLAQKSLDSAAKVGPAHRWSREKSAAEIFWVVELFIISISSLLFKG